MLYISVNDCFIISYLNLIDITYCDYLNQYGNYVKNVAKNVCTSSITNLTYPQWLIFLVESVEMNITFCFKTVGSYMFQAEKYLKENVQT